MTDHYISQNTIKESFNILTTSELNYDTEFFYFLILKHAGIDQYNFISVADDQFKNKIFEATKMLAWLFLNDENSKDKKARNNFINPFHMSSWENQPSESLRLWSATRLMNNIFGGGKQWRNIVVSNEQDPNLVKLKHDYLNFFDNMQSKFPLDVVSIWLFRFTKFPQEVSQSKINSNFYDFFNFFPNEKEFFFSTKKNVTLTFSDSPTDPAYIRELIGNPPKNPDWLEENRNVDFVNVSNQSDIYNTVQGFNNSQATSIKSELYYKNLLEFANQAILMGPPGTSKSYVASNLSNSFDCTKRIQFHPQYSYQDFIGGKILDNGKILDEKGEFITFLEQAIDNPTDSFLLIIEEINRANVSQVFGELIQLLDRGEVLSLEFNGKSRNYSLPINLKIIGTMNTTDRTVGRIDYAIKRRFYQIYFGPNYEILVDNVTLKDNEFSVADLLQKINSNLVATLNNKEMVIGHAIFLSDRVKKDDKFVWSISNFSDLFNYVVVPIIQDYCNGNTELINNVIGESLQNQLQGDDFVNAVNEYLTK